MTYKKTTTKTSTNLNFMKQQVNNKCITSSTTNVDNWIIEAESSYNDGYTREYYTSLLRDLKQRLNSLEILNEQNHG